MATRRHTRSLLEAVIFLIVCEIISTDAQLGYLKNYRHVTGVRPLQREENKALLDFLYSVAQYAETMSQGSDGIRGFQRHAGMKRYPPIGSEFIGKRSITQTILNDDEEVDDDEEEDVNKIPAGVIEAHFLDKKLGSEFLGKRGEPQELQRRLESEMLGKRMGSEFLGKRMGSEFLGKRMGSEFLGKRMGSEFLGKRMGSEFLGKRMGSEFLGKRMDSEFLENNDRDDHSGNRIGVLNRDMLADIVVHHEEDGNDVKGLSQDVSKNKY